MSVVFCKLPKAGLGNQLFPLMKALVFAELNDLPCIVVGYHQIKLGPYLRSERSKRKYSGYFSFEKNIFGEVLDMLKIKMRVLSGHLVVREPELATIPVSKKTIYEFARLPHWSNYFDQLKNYRALVIDLFWKSIRAEIRYNLALLDKPIIGVHVRLGDFRKLLDNEDFAKVGAVRTPQEYFKGVILSIRQLSESNLRVSIFTDGYKSELASLLELDNVMLVEGNTDMIDLLLLSASKVIVTSAGSTFSYWSGFLSKAPIIIHPDHVHQTIRGNFAEGLFEGGFDENDPTLHFQIRAL